MRRAFVLTVFALSGAATALAFPPFDMPWLAWAGLAPALVAAASVPLEVALFGGFLFGMTQALTLVPWFFGLWGPFAIALHIHYAVYFALVFAFIQAVAARFGAHALLWAAPPLWVAAEFVRSEIWVLKFSWFCLGYSQHDNVPFLQAASIGGAVLLSLIIVTMNGALAWFLHRPSRRRLLAPVAAALVVAGIHLAGTGLPDESGGYAIIGLEGEKKTLDGFVAASVRELERGRADLVVWPEMSVPAQLDDGHPCVERVRALAREHAAPVLFGTTRAAGDDFENTLFLVPPEGPVQTQVKSVPVPFMNDGRPARDRTPLDVGGARVGAAICYDMDFAFVSRELVVEGAEVLVFPTMDARGWGRVQHLQHFSLAPFRAVEHRRWLVRVASSGISCVVDPWGRVRQSTGIGETVIRCEVALRSDATLYSRVGYHLPHACLVAAALLLAACALRRHSGGARSS